MPMGVPSRVGMARCPLRFVRGGPEPLIVPGVATSRTPSFAMPAKKTDLEWLEDHLRILLDTGKKVRDIEPAVTNEFGPWTTLKLIGVEYWQRIYTDIIQEHLKGLKKKCMAYLDIMAGSGLNRIPEADCIVGGSSLLAATVPRKPFHYIVSIESNRTRAAALERRLQKLRQNPDSFHVVPGLADDVIEEVLAELRERKAHFMAFIDYQGMKGFSYNSMDALLDEPCDIWFTYFPNIKRSFALRGWDQGNLEACREFFGTEVLDASYDYEELIANWVARLSSKRPIIYSFPILSGEGYGYELVFMTNRTRTGSPYTRAADQLEKRLASMRGDFASMVLQILSGKQAKLDGFSSGRPPSAP